MGNPFMRLAEILVQSTDLPKKSLISMKILDSAISRAQTEFVTSNEDGTWTLKPDVTIYPTGRPLTVAIVARTSSGEKELVSKMFDTNEAISWVVAHHKKRFQLLVCMRPVELTISCLIKLPKSDIARLSSVATSTPTTSSAGYTEPRGDYVATEPGSEGLPSRGMLEEVYLLAKSVQDSGVLRAIGQAYYLHHKIGRNAADLERAISILEEAVQFGSSHPGQSGHCYLLSIVLEERYNRYRDRTDIERAISTCNDRLNLMTEGDGMRHWLLSRLAQCHGSLYKQRGKEEDLRKQVIYGRKAVASISDDHPDKPALYSNVSIAHRLCFERYGTEKELEIALSCLQEAVKLSPEGHPGNAGYYNNLGSTYLNYFEHHGNTEALDKAISIYEQAVKLSREGHPDNADYYNNLGNAYQNYFKRHGSTEALDKAISSLEQAVKLSPKGHPGNADYCNNLGTVYIDYFERNDRTEALDKAISSFEQAVKLSPEGRLHNAGYYNNLGSAYLRYFERHGSMEALDKAISSLEQAVKLIPKGHPHNAGYYNNLGTVYLNYFEHHSSTEALDKAISSFEQAVKLSPEGYSDNAHYYNNLGSVYGNYFERHGSKEALDKAISSFEQAVKLTPEGHPLMPSRYNNLGNVYRNYFQHHGNTEALDKAISSFEQAVKLSPEGHPYNACYYNNLGNAYRSYFECHSSTEASEKAISSFERAVRLIPSVHPNRIGIATNLVGAYLQFIRLFSSNDSISVSTNYLLKAHALSCEATKSAVGPPRYRLRVALLWAECSGLLNESLIPAFTYAIELLPRVAWLGISVGDQHFLLAEVGSTVRRAVAAAIKEEKYELAAEWAEQGRTIVWQNMLQLRTPVDELSSQHPDLASRLQSVSRQLDAPITPHSSELPKQEMAVQTVGRHSQLVMEWERLVNEIQGLPGFQSFLKPKAFSDFSSAAREGPIVILNVDEGQCDALVIIPSDNENSTVINIPLPNLSYSKSESLLAKLREALKAARVRDRGYQMENMSDVLTSDDKGSDRDDRKLVRKKFGEVFDPEREIKFVLRELWELAVKPVVDGLAYSPRDGKLPRIWWCGTGPLAFLPIHAAGNYDAGEIGEKLSDYVVSSYTPTISALLDPPPSIDSESFQLLAVAVPSARGASHIPNTLKEVEKIEKIADRCTISLVNDMARRDEVLRRMEECHWAHFACHGQQNMNDLMKSGLILHDGTLELSTLVKQSFPKAQFAFLSACQTATGDEKVSEESVHLAAGMLLSGYRGVVATMWSIGDAVAPGVAQDVYGRMLKDGKPRREEGAYALHDAVKRLRDSGENFVSWVPFIHVGL